MSIHDQHRDDDKSSVCVAIRIRPQNAKEKLDLCRLCTVVTDKDRQIVIGKDKAFTFDYVFDVQTQQSTVYNTCISSLVEGCFEGYNATVFAYGQTGSGKTYTMGTDFDTSITDIAEEIGIVPRAVDHLFGGIEKRRNLAFENKEPAPDFKVTAQFIELYNEEIIDLLDTAKDPLLKGKKSHNRIHEDASGGIYVVGVNIRAVSSLDDTLQCLKFGALSRATASTNMNISSSRSHAIFTLHIRQHRAVKDESLLVEGKEADSSQTEFETLTAKFHFVDLAGSERLKRTGATGDRARESISINCGLLALGNVISALGDNTKKGCHVPYRDSKLTRLLQDSLGGNSHTLMIACISPSDRDFMETMNTLKYANRARNIRNNVVANQDKASRQLALLRAEIVSLQTELMDYKKGKRSVDTDSVQSLSGMVIENSLLQSDNHKLRLRIKALQDTIEAMKMRNSQLLADATLFSAVGSDGQASSVDISNLMRKYIHEIEDLKAKLAESQSLCEHLNATSVWCLRSPSSRLSLSSTSVSSSFAGEMCSSASSDPSESSVLQEAKTEMRRLKRLQKLSLIRVGRGCCQGKAHNARSSEEVSSKEKLEVDRNWGDSGDEDVNDDEDESSEASLDSEEKGRIHDDLANLTYEITVKQRLIEELEVTQMKMNALRTHYENRVQQLQLKIKETEIERDRVLSDIVKISHSSADTRKKVKHEFDQRLSSLQEELKKMQTEQRKHTKMQKSSSQHEQHLRTLQHELSDMKKSKVKLMKQVKEEVDKNKRCENRCSKELNKLQKEQVRMDNIIKTLERQTAQKDAVLKRKQEEVDTLRKRQKSTSADTSRKLGKCCVLALTATKQIVQEQKQPEFCPKIAKQKWDSLEKHITSMIYKRQTISILERDMNVWLEQRERCTKEIEKYQQRKQEAVNSNQVDEVVRKLDRTIDDLSLKAKQAEENILECQSNIMHMEESKEGKEASLDIGVLMETMTMEECKYMIDKFYQRALDRGLSVAHKESEVQELQGRLHQTELNNTLQQNLLHHMISDHVSIEMDDPLTTTGSSDEKSVSRSISSPPIERLERQQELLKTLYVQEELDLQKQCFFFLELQMKQEMFRRGSELCSRDNYISCS